MAKELFQYKITEPEDNTFVDITVAVDTIATSGVSGGIKYNTNSRIK